MTLLRAVYPQSAWTKISDKVLTGKKWQAFFVRLECKWTTPWDLHGLYGQLGKKTTPVKNWIPFSKKAHGGCVASVCIFHYCPSRTLSSLICRRKLDWQHSQNCVFQGQFYYRPIFSQIGRISTQYIDSCIGKVLKFINKHNLAWDTCLFSVYKAIFMAHDILKVNWVALHLAV